MAIDWIRVVEEMFKPQEIMKPLQRALFELWLDSVKTGDHWKANQYENLLEDSGCAVCPDCTFPIDPDESYCIPCHDRKREKLKSRERARKKKWECLVSLRDDLATFHNCSPRNIDHLASALEETVKRLAKGRRTESSVWAEFQRVHELVKGNADIDDKWIEKQFSCTATEFERELLKHLHQLMMNVPALGPMIKRKLQASTASRRPKKPLGVELGKFGLSSYPLLHPKPDWKGR
jgi:hypothetical protein